MCEAKPGVRCANDTRGQVSVTLARYQDAHPDGPAVDPLSAAATSMDTPISVPNPDDPTDMPIYEGPAGEAADRLVPGTYSAEHLHDGGTYELTVTPMSADALQTSSYDYQAAFEQWQPGDPHPQDVIAGRVAVHTTDDGQRLVGTVVNSGGHYPHLSFTDGRHARLSGTIELVDEGSPTGGLENVPGSVQEHMLREYSPEKQANVIEASQNPERRDRCQKDAIRHFRSDHNNAGQDFEVLVHPQFPKYYANRLAVSGDREGAYWAWKEGRAHPDDAAYEEIWAGRQGGFSEAKVRANLEHHQQTLEDLKAKRVRPSKVVGTGYKNTRAVAFEWLNSSIAHDEEAIASRGRSHSVNQANVAYRRRNT